MNIEDVMEWFQIADNDFDSAKILEVKSKEKIIAMETKEIN